ncbi:MAG: AI-2E family transporter [Streptococcaceae bacterium]|jgi:predicted PurR-regulated permease PerM|nr:AI-2E family transporter [Streptococcaceae bacterium]
MQKPSKPDETPRVRFRASYFYKWMLNNKVVTALAVLLLVLLNILLVRTLSFVFVPVGTFLSTIAIPVVLAAVFYYLLNPLVNVLEKRHVPRVVTIALIFLILAALIVWGLAVVIPGMVDGITVFSKHVPHYVDNMRAEVSAIFADPRFEQFRPQFNKISTSVGNSLIDWSKNASANFVTSLTGLLTKTAEIVISIIIFPFVLFYLLRDGKSVRGYLVGFLPNRWRENTASVLTEINQQLQNYVLGQVAIAAAVFVMLIIMLPIVGLRLAFLVALVSGILNLIPFLGFYLALVPALILALATGGPLMLIKVLVVFIIEEQVVSRLIQPLVLGAQMKIHPITIIFILLTSGKLFGVWGVLLGIPVYAAAKVIVSHIYSWYREVSEMYETGNVDVVDGLVEESSESGVLSEDSEVESSSVKSDMNSEA